MKLTQDEKQNCAIIAALLSTAFDWAATPEGHEYWMKVSVRLEEMADGVEGEG